MDHNPGVGATDELSLRVSVATLVRVIFQHPLNDEWMLALERQATLRKTENERIVEVKSQPFGGAIRILNLNALHDLIGDFHFDSERSRAEQDFRLFIRPLSWSRLREFCIQHLGCVDDSVLETDPTRELVEEFHDALKINLRPEQYSRKAIATVVEDNPAPTANIHAKGMPTVRIYRIFEALILDSVLTQTVMATSQSLSHQDLCELALNDAQMGGKGRANTILALPMKHIRDAYLAMSPQERTAPVLFETNRLDATVPVVLDSLIVSKYQRL